MASLHCYTGVHNLSQQNNSTPTIPHNIQSSPANPKFRPQLAAPTEALRRKQNLKYDFRGSKPHDILWRVWSSNEGLVGPEMESVQDLVHDFFHAINLKDTKKLDHHLSSNCIFQDPIFYIPFGGKQSVINFLCDAMDALGASVNLVVDEASAEEDYLSTTVTWHLGKRTNTNESTQINTSSSPNATNAGRCHMLQCAYTEWKGKKIPLTDGSSFFEFEELHGQGPLVIRKIIGMEELPVKPGELVLKLLKTTRMAFDSFPTAAEGLLERSQGQGSPEGLLKLLEMLRAYIKK